MQIIPLSEGVFTVGKDKQFVPFSLQADDLQQRPAGSLLVEVQPFAVRTASEVILLDTGMGFDVEGEMHLHRNLRANGIEPDQVTRVLMSHLHKDHAGGMFHNGAPSFPKALYYVQVHEFEEAMAAGKPSYMTDEIGLLRRWEQTVWLDGDGTLHFRDKLEVRYEVTGGHSRHHQVFWLTQPGETAFFGGDDAPQLQQMRHRFVAKYDHDGKKCMELRKQWWEAGAAAGWEFLFYHDVRTPSWKAL